MSRIEGARRPLSRASRSLAITLAAATAVLLLPTVADAAGLTARGSAEQVQVTGATAGASYRLVDAKGKKVAAQKAGSLGGIVFRHVKAGKGYVVKGAAGSSSAVTVFTTRPPPVDTSFYQQPVPSDGYGYVTTRDGTQLAIDVHLPAGPGPYPTLIEYSGYGYADPSGGESSIAQIPNLLGYAVVDVNMRGTGCSGGAFDYFERLQSLDGYDVIETIARQPWVLHNKVGMMGISYGGISQLFTGSTNPPSLAAITPLSVIDNTATTLYPGGILNNGFALSWAKDRVHDALPASATGGQKWALKRIEGGDETCKANQDLHAEAIDLLAKTAANRFYVPKVADPLAPITFVHKIKAPTFLACQWTDEQTGGHCGALADRFTSAKRKWFTFTNGTHIDSLDPATFNRWYDFLELYVAKRAPKLSATSKAAAGIIFQSAMGVSGVTLPPDPIQDQPTYEAALAAYEKIPSVRIMFDNGAGGPTAGGPVAGFEQSFATFPRAGGSEGTARSWYLGPNGTLNDAKPKKAGADAFTWNPKALEPTNFTGDTSAGNLWTASPTYTWAPSPAGTALSYLSGPLAANTTVVGPGSVEAWVKADKPSVDLQVTVSEVRPDGKETFVQGGWLRASSRKLDPKKSTLLAPQPSLRKQDAAPLPKGKWSKVAIPLYYQGHAYRKGSKLRIVLSAPGGNQPIWAFDAQPVGSTAKVKLAYSAKMPSRVILPAVKGISVPTPLPPCPGLRGEPCRDSTALANAKG